MVKRILLMYTSRADFYLLNHLCEELETRDCITDIVLSNHEYVFREHDYDWCVLLGDRYETMKAAVLSVRNQVPIAHIHGGEITSGSMDEYFRHAITKLSNLHFAATAKAAQNIRQMGEQPDTVFHVGAIGAEMVSRKLPNGVIKKNKTIIVTFHPDTVNGVKETERQVNELLCALDEFVGKYHIILTEPNIDLGYEVIHDLISEFKENNPDYVIVTDGLGDIYHKICASSKMVVGNSSSGIIEIPCLRTPTVNIGDRQKGRESGSSVIDCPCETDSIIKAMTCAKNRDLRSKPPNPYYKENTTKNIADILLKTEPTFGKTFHNCVCL